MEQEKQTFRVIDLKQYIYCPRILYYHTVLPQVRPLTYKMEAGKKAHEQTEGKEKRRSLRSYGLTTGERTFNVPLYSEEMGLSGEIDMLIETDTDLIPVDFKHTKKVGNHFKMQLMGYGRLLENRSGHKKITRGFLYLIPTRQAIEVSFTKRLHTQLNKAVAELERITKQQIMPPATTQYGRCLDCEFRRFCNDVL